MPVTLSTRDPGFETGFRQLLAAKRESAADVDAAVAEIIEDVAARGDAALIDYTRRFDGTDLAAGDRSAQFRRGVRLRAWTRLWPAAGARSVSNRRRRQELDPGPQGG